MNGSGEGVMPGGALRASRLQLAVGAVALVVYLGALANRFAMDDIPLIVQNPLMTDPSGWWHAFTAPYWPADLGAAMYRPFPVSSWVLDRMIDGPVWYHLVNLIWHAAVSLAVFALTRRLAGEMTALFAGLLFAVHPVHVEAVANLVGRAELMAALCVVAAAYFALVRGSVGWSAAAWALGLLCKESAAVFPALVVWGWIIGLGGGRPTRQRAAAFLASWIVVGGLYGLLRAHVLIPAEQFQSVAPVFLGQSPVAIRLTAMAAFADIARLLVFPLTLRVDYSPDERTLITSPLDPRFAFGLLCFLAWGALLVRAWRRGERVEAFGLGWIGIALLPVANLVMPVGFLVAERTLYLPSVGFVIVAATWIDRLRVGRRVAVAAALVALGAIRTAVRVPVWRDNMTVTLSILTDSPRSYVGPKRMTAVYLDLHQPAQALDAARRAARINTSDPTLYVTGAVAAFAAGRPASADSMLADLERLCHRCVGYYRREAATARQHGYAAAADSLDARAAALGSP